LAPILINFSRVVKLQGFTSRAGPPHQNRWTGTNG
jgi:hypothetical protein